MGNRYLSTVALKSLGFKENIVTPEQAGDEKGYKYYTYELYNGECLITNADNENDDIYYTVSFLMMFDAPPIETYEELKNLISTIKRTENCPVSTNHKK